MRLWHKDLIPVLPDKQLVSQWRECCAIARKIAVDGTPNHLLVNEVLNYPVLHFMLYIDLVLNEMHNRNIRISERAYTELKSNLERGVRHYNTFIHQYVPAYTSAIFKDWHNDRYLKQCIYNLQEKYDRGGITKEDWDKIANLLLNLVS